MIFNIGDKFVVEGTEGVVLYANAGFAWLFPLEDAEANKEFFRNTQLLTGVAFAKLDSKGRLKDGTKAHVVNKTECLAV